MKPGAPGRIRTRDPLLRRHIVTVAQCRLTSPYGAFSCSDGSLMSPYVAQSLSLLAPRLAPRDLVASANVRIGENSVACATVPGTARGPSLSCGNAVSSTATGTRMPICCLNKCGTLGDRQLSHPERSIYAASVRREYSRFAANRKDRSSSPPSWRGGADRSAPSAGVAASRRMRSIENVRIAVCAAVLTSMRRSVCRQIDRSIAQRDEAGRALSRVASVQYRMVSALGGPVSL